ncbi:ArnT family glycosyltransferase [Salinisphaera aquimarina]|uniref:ArnT family glycosyltransferase n=1 Tax=Salinisphaera aquimarina TaxID=2094031 RepID=A0ABV7EQ09_9GAMM
MLKAFMCLAIALGAYARLRGLGTWPWATDEYLTNQSVANIIRYGVPAFDCGGYYLRGIFLQYLIAPLEWGGIHPELAARLVPVAFSFVALAAVYFLGKRLSGTTVACVCVSLLSLSLWEIEFARFARMYMPFQAIFLCYLLALHRVVVDRHTAAFGWLWLLSLAGVFTWAGGLFLLVVNFLPHAIKDSPGRFRHMAVSGALLLVGYIYSGWNFRVMGAVPPLPSDVPINLVGEHVVMPPLLLSTLSSHPAWLVGALLLLGLSLAVIVTLVRAYGIAARERIGWTALVILSLFNLFGCVVLGLVLLLLLGWIDIRRASRRCAYIVALAIASNFVFWFAYALLTHGWYALFPGFKPGGELSKLAVVLFKYPNVVDSTLAPWLAAVPTLAVLLGGLAAAAVIWSVLGRDEERVHSLRLTLAVCVVMVVLASLVDTKYIRTRYTFFLLPLLYLVAMTVIHTLLVRPIRSYPKRSAVVGLTVIATMGLTEDFGWAHLIHVDSTKWNYRLPYGEALTAHYYPREDFRTPAQYVNRHAGPQDLVVTTKPVATYYLDRTDYVYWNYSWGEFAGISCDAGRRERWSGSDLLYRRDDLFDAVDKSNGNIWLITLVGEVRPPIDELSERYSVTLVYRGLAGAIGVYKIERAQ